MRLENDPLVSILMITYNHEAYITQAIEGILAQSTDFKLELVIGEDFSTDSTREICQKYAAKFPSQIVLLPTSHNLGIMSNFERTLKACRGKYVAVCEGDDFWTDDRKLQKQFELLEKNKNANLCFHPCREFNEVKKDYSGIPPFKKEQYTFFDFARRGCFIHTCSVMFRNSKVDIVNQFSNWTYRLSGADYLLYLLCTKDQHTALAMNDIMGVYRIHPGGSWTGLSDLRRVELMDNDLTLYKENIALSGKEKAFLNFQLKRIILGYLSFYFSHKNGLVGKSRRVFIFLINRIYFIFGAGYVSSFLASVVYPLIRKRVVLMKEISKGE